MFNFSQNVYNSPYSLDRESSLQQHRILVYQTGNRLYQWHMTFAKGRQNPIPPLPHFVLKRESRSCTRTCSKSQRWNVTIYIVHITYLLATKRGAIFKVIEIVYKIPTQICELKSFKKKTTLNLLDLGVCFLLSIFGYLSRPKSRNIQRYLLIMAVSGSQISCASKTILRVFP